MFPHCVPLVISVSDRGYDFHAFAPAPPAPSETATVAATAATSPMPTTALFVRIAMTLISLLWSIGLDAVAGAAPAAGTRSRSLTRASSFVSMLVLAGMYRERLTDPGGGCKGIFPHNCTNV